MNTNFLVNVCALKISSSRVHRRQQSGLRLMASLSLNRPTDFLKYRFTRAAHFPASNVCQPTIVVHCPRRNVTEMFVRLSISLSVDCGFWWNAINICRRKASSSLLAVFMHWFRGGGDTCFRKTLLLDSSLHRRVPTAGAIATKKIELQPNQSRQIKSAASKGPLKSGPHCG